MRTTVTLEPEAERLLKEAMRRRGQSFKDVLNHAVCKGLADLEDAGDPRLTGVRQALADEKRSLEAMEKTDIAGITLTLASLAATVESRRWMH